MSVKIAWETEPIVGKSLARTGTLTVGGKSLTFPLRATSVSKNTSEFEMVLGASGRRIPMNTIATYFTPLSRAGLDNLTQTNGRFSQRKNEARESLARIDEQALRIVYARIPAKENVAKPGDRKRYEVLTKRLTEDEGKAVFDFLDGIPNNDVMLLPVPPSIEKVDALDPVLRAWKQRIDTVGTRKHLMAYIPSVENPVLARQILEKYLSSPLEFRMFAVDLANGHAERTSMEIVTTLLQHWKSKEIEDFYIHGIDARHFYDTGSTSAAVEDMYSHLIGFDSFNNVLYAGGGKKPRAGDPQSKVFAEFNKKLRYWHEADYGGHRFDEAIERSRRGRCPCPVCSGHDIEEVYRESSFDTAYRLLRSHHIFSELAGEKRQTEHIRAGNLDTYLCKKEIPVRSGLVGRIVRQIGAVRIT